MKTPKRKLQRFYVKMVAGGYKVLDRKRRSQCAPFLSKDFAVEAARRFNAGKSDHACYAWMPIRLLDRA